MSIDLFPAFVRENYEIHEWKHASAILKADLTSEWNDVISVLTQFRLKSAYINTAGGNKSAVSYAIDQAFSEYGWREMAFGTTITIQPHERRPKTKVDNRKGKVVTGGYAATSYESPTHNVDCFKNGVALEIEWNNKDPFFDRDLNNFRLLFDLRVASVGIIITRCDELQLIFNKLGRGSSYGMSTTHMSKLLPRIHGGGGGGCPILVFGIKPNLYIEDELIDQALEQFMLDPKPNDESSQDEERK